MDDDQDDLDELHPVFTAGDTVVLNSGGAAMTIEKVIGDKAQCVWHDRVGAVHFHPFSLHTLRMSDGILVAEDDDDDE